MIALSSNELLVVHTDSYDKRLIVLGSDGTVHWERSIAWVHRGRPILVTLEDRPYIFSEYDSGNTGDFALFAVDLEQRELIRVFDGGTRHPQPRETWAVAFGESQLLLNLAGGQLLVLDVAAAEDAIRQAVGAQ
jgi:hypothetical protein